LVGLIGADDDASVDVAGADGVEDIPGGLPGFWEGVFEFAIEFEVSGVELDIDGEDAWFWLIDDA
jgi:hypothetical protein